MRSYLDAEYTSRAGEFITPCFRLIRWKGCQPALRYHSPTVATRETTQVTVERSAELSDEYSAVDAE